MNIKSMIAFQTVDCENDYWCNKALLFSTQKEVNSFFSNYDLVIETLELEVDPNEDIADCIKLYKHDNGNIYGMDINLEFCGNKKIRQMHSGHLILNS